MSDLEERLIAEGLCPVCAEMGHNGCATEYAADLRARLAAVEALCDNPHAYVAGERIPVVHVSAVRHALRGEGDRPAEPCPNCGQPVRVEDSHACIVTREGGS